MPRTRNWSSFRSLNSVEKPAVRLVCFPHSGGPAAVFASWARGMRSDVHLIAAQYPGHGDCFGQEPLKDVREITACIAKELTFLEPLPCVLLGHSLGALVAYETANALCGMRRMPLGLFVSGCRSPAQAGGGGAHLLSDHELWDEICRLGGVDRGAADNKELAAAVLPALRSDITAHECYRPQPGATPLPCPVRCYRGTADPLVSRAAAAGWSAVTADSFDLVELNGGHFHLFNDSEFLIKDILAFIDSKLHPEPQTRSQS